MRRVVTAREQAQMLAPWLTAAWSDYDDDYEQRRAEEDAMWDQHGQGHGSDWDEGIPDWDPQAEEDAMKSAVGGNDAYADRANATYAERKNASWANYANLIEPKDHGRNGPRPPLTMEPVTTESGDGVMARHAADGRPVGHLMWHPDGEIDSVNTHPDFQGQGIANAMLHHVRSNPPKFPTEGPIRHSTMLSPFGEAWARSDPHHTMPPEGQFTRINTYVDQPGRRYETYLKNKFGGEHNYIPANQPYGDSQAAQNERIWRKTGFVHPQGAEREFVPAGFGHVGEHMGEKAVNQRWAKRGKHLWPRWWDNKPHPDVPFPKHRRVLGEHPEPEEILRRAQEPHPDHKH